MKNLKIIFLLLTTISIAASCTKYEEGPKISFKRTKKKLEAHTWNFSYSDYADTTSTLAKDLLNWKKIKFDGLNLSINDTLVGEYDYNRKFHSILLFIDTTKKDMSYLNSNGYNLEDGGANYNVFYRILKLDKNELKIKADNYQLDNEIIIGYEK